MSSTRRTTLAEEDLLGLWLRIAETSVEAADRLIDRIVGKCDRAALFPDSGTLREEFGTGIRSLPEGHYLILYRRVADGIEVLRIFDGRRDPATLIAEMRNPPRSRSIDEAGEL